MIHLGFVLSEVIWDVVGGSSAILCGAAILSGIILLVVGEKKDLKKDIPIERKKFFCPYCGISNKLSSNFCEYCGSSIGDFPVKLGLVKSAMENENSCLDCGGPIQKFECIACGRSIKQ